MSDPDVLAELLTRVPLRRLGLIDEVIAGVMFLAGNDSSYVNAAEFVIDGGALSL